MYLFKKLFFLQLSYVGGMLMLGLSHLFFLLAFTSVPADKYPFIISITAFTYIAGILALVTPGGLGVREGIWYGALRRLTTKPLALIFTFASRIWSIAIETILMLISIVTLILYKKHKKKIAPSEPTA